MNIFLDQSMQKMYNANKNNLAVVEVTKPFKFIKCMDI